jgi:hypothetical protein
MNADDADLIFQVRVLFAGKLAADHADHADLFRVRSCGYLPLL